MSDRIIGNYNCKKCGSTPANCVCGKIDKTQIIEALMSDNPIEKVMEENDKMVDELIAFKKLFDGLEVKEVIRGYLAMLIWDKYGRFEYHALIDADEVKITTEFYLDFNGSQYSLTDIVEIDILEHANLLGIPELEILKRLK